MSEQQNSLMDFWAEFDSIFPGGAGDIENAKDRLNIASFLDVLSDSLTEGLEMFLNAFLTIFGMCLLTVFFKSLCFDEKRGKMLETVSVTMTGFMLLEIAKPLVMSVEGSLSSLSKFLSAVSPIYTGVLVSAGNVNTAQTQGVTMNLIITLLSILLDKILLPLSFGIFAFAILSPFSESHGQKIGKALKNIFLFTFGIISTLLMSSMALQNLVSYSADSLYLKTAKQMTGALIPAVGSVISGSLSSLMGAFVYIKSAIGGFSVLFIITLFLPSFLAVLILRWGISLCSSFLEYGDCKEGVRLFSCFQSGIDTLLSAYVLGFLLAVFATVSFMKGGVGLFG